MSALGELRKKSFKGEAGMGVGGGGGGVGSFVPPTG